MNQPDLFAFGESTYPHIAGHRGVETSIAAAASVDVETLRAKVLTELGKFPMTADEIAARLDIDKLSIRPRCSELKALNRICDSGERRPNASGRSAAVFTLAA